MPSGKRAKQRRATVPTPPAARAQGTRQASPRVLAIAGVVLLAIIAAIVAAVLLTGGKGKSDTSTLPLQGSLVNALPEAAQVHAEFKGIRQAGLFLGKADAPVHLVEYIDLQCPYCQRFETISMPTLVQKYVRTGKVEVEARPLAFIGPDSIRGRNGMFAASLQGHAFDFAQLLYDNQETENTGWLNDAIVSKAATSIPGVNPRLLVQVSTSATMVALGNRVNQEAKIDKVKGTPTILVGKTGTRPKEVTLKSPTDTASVSAAIEAALS
ncbi:MAG TPA: thioredoxin domain-containing protein [Gaiellaceae bacterium]|nr:thioredoxin domain-containing protein [Gaiellaceae bacterium]